MLSKKEIIALLKALGKKLDKAGIRGEIGIVGGAAMALAFDTRKATKDIDAIFRPSSEIRKAAKEIADDRGLPENWLNDAVKGFLPTNPEKKTMLDVPGLLVWIPELPYLLAMKGMSARYDSQDANDLKLLIEHLKLKSPKDVLAVIEKYYPNGQIPPKTQYFIEELFESKSQPE